MKKFSIVVFVCILAAQGILTDFGQNNDTGAKKVIPILENEKWCGGATLDGRNMPFAEGKLTYDQAANCKVNQAAPLFISNMGRFIWSGKPLNISIEKGMIIAGAGGNAVVSGKAGETLKDAFLYASRTFFPPSGKTPDRLMFTSPQYNTWIELQYD